MVERVEILNVATGEVRAIEKEIKVRYDESAARYLWSDGNFGCDCNREMFFREAGNEPEGELACSSGNYLVRVFLDGKLVYLEFENAELSGDVVFEHLFFME